MELNSNANIRVPSDGGSSVDDDDEFSVLETTNIILATSDDNDDETGRKVSTRVWTIQPYLGTLGRILN